MESEKTNESELTSTMGNLLSTSKDDKNDASDSTPTSSTDAFTTSSTSQFAADDPISSTSSDVSDSKRSTDKVNDVAQSSSNVMSSNPVISPVKEMPMRDQSSPIASEKDLLDMNITDTSTEKITENVDDIVQDLENLLGEPTTSFNFTIRGKSNRSTSSVSQDKDISMDIDAFSAELQRLSEQSTESKPAVKETVNIDKKDVNKTTDDLNTKNISTNTAENILEKPEVNEKVNEIEVKETKPEEEIVISGQKNNESNVQTDSITEVKNCQSEIISESENTELIKVEETSEVLESQDITSTELKNEHVEESPESLQQPKEEEKSQVDPKEAICEATKSPDELPASEEVEPSRESEKDKMEVVPEDESTKEVKETSCKTEEAVESLPTKKAEDVKTEEHKVPEEKLEEGNSQIGDVPNTADVPPEKAAVEEDIQSPSASDNQNAIDDVKPEEPKIEITVDAVTEVIIPVVEPEAANVVESTEKHDLDTDNSAVIPEVSESVVKHVIPEKDEDPQIAPEDTVTEEVKEVAEEKSTEVTIEVVCEKMEVDEVVVEEKMETEPSDVESLSKEQEVVVPEPDDQKQPVPSSADEETKSPSIDPLDTIAIEIEPVIEAPDAEKTLDAASEKISEKNEEHHVAIDEKKEEQHVEMDEKNEAITTDESDPKKEILTDQNEEQAKKEVEVAPVETVQQNELESVEVETSEKDQKIESDTQVSADQETTEPNDENITCEVTESPSEQAPTVETSAVHMDTPPEELPTTAPVNLILETIEMPSNSLAVDLDLLVQNTVSSSPTLLPPEDDQKTDDSEISTSTAVDCKTLEIMENNMLPVALEHVPDLEVLNAISTLSDNNSTISDVIQDVQENDALLSSSVALEQSSDVPFEAALPTVDEIFAEPNQEQQDELPDENLETLLAVASLQNVDYNITPVEEYSPPMEPIENLIPEESIPIVEELPSFVEEKVLPVEVKEPPVLRNKESNEDLQRREVKEAKQQQENKLKEPLVINVDDTDKDRVYSPKITIKPIKPPDDEEAVTSISCDTETSKGSLKMTITKQSDNTHSILKIYDPNNDNSHTDEHLQPEPSVPKLIIKPIVQPNEQPHSPKMSTRSSKQVFSPSSSANQRSASPRITIKPIPKPDEPVAPLKITIKPVLKTDEGHKQKHSPKLTIKPIVKPDEESSVEPKTHSPRVTIKPIVKPPDEMEQVSSPRITIKPIVKPTESHLELSPTTPRVTIKPLVKPSEKDKNEASEQVERSSPKITIKPILKPHENESIPVEDFEESIKERIVLKINKGTIPGSSKESRKRELPLEEEKSEKLAKIKLKFSKEGGHPQIVSPTKRPIEQIDHEKNKRQRIDTEHFLPGVTITPIAPSTHSKLKEMLSRNDHDKVVTIDDDDEDIAIVDEQSKSSPIVISEESNQDSMAAHSVDLRDPISEIPVFEITPDCVKTIKPQPVPVVELTVLPPTPRKRGRPRKVPLQVREDFKDPKEEEPKPEPVVVESTRPKRSCRGQSVRATLGIKPRKPRGGGRGRGSKRGMGTRSTPTPPETPPPRAAKEPKLGGGTKLKELKEESFLLSDKSEVKTIEIDDGLQKSPSNSLLAPPQSDTSTTDRADIVMYEEETRMSAETSSRAQTPAKQVVTTIPTVDLVEESQSSVQSTATTESVKVRRGPRLEVHQEPEGAVISADQLAEYYWSGGGPFMLQEQVAQYLGIKSFKRKYPNFTRRVVDMQERDFIRESGLAGEAMCDLGLTAVNSSDILDIMYSDFQDKYEEYCKHQRDRQAKDLINKQKALSLAASQEKAKMDITQQAVQSAASWNATFNKARRDQRKSCMDLQTLTIHFPKGKMKQINKPKIGYYPVALVPGQFTDYYREFTPTEINNLPLSTLCYDTIIRAPHEMECDSQTDGSGSESDTSSSGSDSSYSGSSDGEDCTLCKHTPKRIAAAQ